MCVDISFWPLSAFTSSEVKIDHARVLKQRIYNKFIEVNFCVRCFFWWPNPLFQDWTWGDFVLFTSNRPISFRLLYTGIIDVGWVVVSFHLQPLFFASDVFAVNLYVIHQKNHEFMYNWICITHFFLIEFKEITEVCKNNFHGL